MLFSVLAATLAATVALFITSNVERGTAHTFRLVPLQTATNSQLDSDAAALVRRPILLAHSRAPDAYQPRMSRDFSPDPFSTVRRRNRSIVTTSAMRSTGTPCRRST